MPTCLKCNKNIGVLSSLFTFNNVSQRCGDCERQIKNELIKFRQLFNKITQDGFFSQQKLDYLNFTSQSSNLNWNEALNYIRIDAIAYLEKYLTFLSSDSIVTDQEENYFHWIAINLQIPKEIRQNFSDRLKYLKYLSNIKKGNLPSYNSSIHLDSDEICHLEIPAIYNKVNVRSVKFIQGRFIITNKKIHFLSAAGGWTILWKNVMQVLKDSNGVYLELAVKNGNGFYQVPDPLLTEAIITSITKMYKRHLLNPNEETQNRYIPQDIKIAVWQRDQGKCVQCKSNSYLEFDHIIPLSKGGANSLNNLQLLCRNCNLKRGNRI